MNDSHDNEEIDKEMIDRLRSQGVAVFAIVRDGRTTWAGTNSPDPYAGIPDTDAEYEGTELAIPAKEPSDEP
jgi:hypothetical protein